MTLLKTIAQYVLLVVNFPNSFFCISVIVLSCSRIRKKNIVFVIYCKYNTCVLSMTFPKDIDSDGTDVPQYKYAPLEHLEPQWKLIDALWTAQFQLKFGKNLYQHNCLWSLFYSFSSPFYWKCIFLCVLYPLTSALRGSYHYNWTWQGWLKTDQKRGRCVSKMQQIIIYLKKNLF